jgi:hypothetical protein
MRVGWALEYVTWPETRRTILLWRLYTINHLAEISRSIIPAPRTRIHNHRVPSSDTPQGVAARRDRRGAWGRTQNLRHRVRRKWSPSCAAHKVSRGSASFSPGEVQERTQRDRSCGHKPPNGALGRAPPSFLCRVDRHPLHQPPDLRSREIFFAKHKKKLRILSKLQLPAYMTPVACCTLPPRAPRRAAAGPFQQRLSKENTRRPQQEV